jgi:hypothetical protein
MGGSLGELALHKLILELGWQFSCAYLILDSKITSKFETWKEKVQKFLPTFKINSDVQQANELLMETFLNES